MNKIYPATIIALFSFLMLNAQTPCIDGMAGDYPCDGYDLLGHLSLSQLDIPSRASDCWGWTDPLDGKEYAILGGLDRTVFIDITDPINLVILGFIPTATVESIWRDIKVYNDHAFIVSEASDHGMQVFDLTRLRDVVSPPELFEEDTHFQGFGRAHNIAINEETGYAYPIGSRINGNSFFAGGPVFINIQDPLNPVLEGGYDGDGYTHDAQIIIYDGPDEEHQCKEIFFGYNENSLTIVDVTDKTNPIQLSRTEYNQTGYAHQGWLNEDRTLVYMNDETDDMAGVNTRTLIMDVSDLDNPSVIEEYFGETEARDHNLYVVGDKVFEANYNAGVRVLQMSDVPGSLLDEVGFFDINPESDGFANSSGAWSVYPYFESGNIIISGIHQGFFVVSSSTITPNDVDPVLADCVVGIRDIAAPSFSVFPVPTNSMINLSMDTNEKINQWQVRDITGRAVLKAFNLHNSSDRLTIDVSSLSPGTYFVSVNQNSVAQKIIVE